MEFLNSLTESTGFVVFGWIVWLTAVASMWKLFLLANKPGWASIIPIYNQIVMLQIINRPTWWILLYLIPGVNFIIAMFISYEFVAAYGKGLGYFFGVLFLPFIFLPMLAFGDSKYIGVKSQIPIPQQTSQAPLPPQAPISQSVSSNSPQHSPSSNQPLTPPQV